MTFIVKDAYTLISKTNLETRDNRYCCRCGITKFNYIGLDVVRKKKKEVK